MSDTPERLHSRQDIADYLGVTRMTLNRWEKIIHLDGRQGGHIQNITREKVDEWFIKVHRSCRYRRPHGRRNIDVTSRRRDVTCTRCRYQDGGYS